MAKTVLSLELLERKLLMTGVSSDYWGLDAIDAPAAWTKGFTGEGVVVAVIDTGVDYSHPDLRNNIWRNPGEIIGNGYDDDQNGYVDDVLGWDFFGDDKWPLDEQGHGTKVAGTIAAERNGFGITGVAPDATIMPVRVLGPDGSGSSGDIVDGIYYAINNGADIINLSLGGSGSRNLEIALRYAELNNVLVVAAAGREGAATPEFPASYSATIASVISVGAYDAKFNRLPNSNGVGGTDVVQVDAPGDNIFSTRMGGGYESHSGTSSATPFVSGIAALAVSASPSLTSLHARAALIHGSQRYVAGSDSLGGVSANSTIEYAQAYGGNRVSADIDADGFVGFRDFVVLANHFGEVPATRESGDVDGDGVVRFSDFLVLASSYARYVARASLPPKTVDIVFESIESVIDTELAGRRSRQGTPPATL